MRGALAVIAALVLSCSESAPTPPANATADASAEASVDAGRVVSLKSNIPGATFTDASEGSPGIALRSFALSYEQTPNDVFRYMGGEVENTGSAIACSITFSASMLHAAGTELDRDNVISGAPPFETPAGVTACLAPGEVGAFRSLGIARSVTRLNDIARVELAFTVTRWETARRHPAEPKLLSSSRSQHADGYTYTTYEMESAGSALRDTAVDTYYFGADGLCVGSERTNRPQWPAGTRWSFETQQGVPGDAARHVTFTMFAVVP